MMLLRKDNANQWMACVTDMLESPKNKDNPDTSAAPVSSAYVRGPES